jgi:hypothetical protein
MPRPASSATIARSVRSGFSTTRANSHSRPLSSDSALGAPIFDVAELPVACQRWHHRTTLGMLTSNSAAVRRRERPAATEATTRSPKIL